MTTTTTTTKPRTDKWGFAITTCGRCAGSGNYSYNQRHGSRCYGCGGSGLKHTKQGAKGWAIFNESLKVPARTLAVGDLMECRSMSGSWFAPITEIAPDAHNPDRIILTTQHPRHGLGGLQTSPDALVRKGWTGAEKKVKAAAALAQAAGKGARHPKRQISDAEVDAYIKRLAAADLAAGIE